MLSSMKLLCNKLLGLLIHCFPIDDREDPDVVSGKLENYPIISDTQLPETSQGSSQWSAKSLRPDGQPLFDGSSDHGCIFRINLWQINPFHVRMVDQIKLHLRTVG